MPRAVAIVSRSVDTATTDRDRIVARLSTLLADGRHGRDLRNDLRAGLVTLPAWMQDLVRELLGPPAVRPTTVDRRRRARAAAGTRTRRAKQQEVRLR